MWKGQDLRAQRLDKRRELLRKKVMPKLPQIHFSESFPATAETMISAVRSQGLEGIVAKRRDSLYELGRDGAWVKMRIGGGQEFVIGRYTPSPKNFDAVLVGYFEGNELMFAARVRNGFVPTLRTTDMEKCVWLKPKLVAAIEYAGWTPANHLRHSRFVACGTIKMRAN